MRSLSIKTKLVASVVLCLVAGGLITAGAIDRSFRRSLDLLTEQSIRNAIASFNNLERGDVRMLDATIQSLLASDSLRLPFAAKDRPTLLARSMVQYDQFKRAFGITNWNYLDLDTTNFLRMTEPALFGDKITRYNVAQCLSKRTVSSGLGLGSHGFALRVAEPVFDTGKPDGKLAGCLELGTEIGRFLEDMKQQTGDEFGMTIRKDKLEEPKWAKSMAFLKQRNNWADQPDVVLAKNTLDDQALFAVGASIDSVPETGRNLGLLETGNTVYSRGLFPLHDASGGRVGLLVVLHDVTQVYREMKSTMRLAGLTIAVLTILLSLALIMVIERLVFRRLDQITRTAKRVVGGDYTTAIVPSSQDEIGSFEALFDQFRVVFVNLVQEVEARNKSDGEGSAASRQPDDRSGK